MLPELALLEIFAFYVDEAWILWYTLAHVCREWRTIVLGSTHRLDLRLYCTASTPVKETLEVWPPLLPIAVWSIGHEVWGMDNIIAALEHNDRIYLIDLCEISSSKMEEGLAAMQQPFPELTCLRLQPSDETAPFISTSLLGGFAPRLEILSLISIPFPGLPKLLLSATNLVILVLRRIPHSGFISPEAMVTCLSVLTSLELLDIGFESPRRHAGWKSWRLPPPTRIPLPALAELQFQGVSEYLEDLVARIDVPLLAKLTITFFHQLIFDTPQLTQFIGRTPKFGTHDHAHAIFSDRNVLAAPQTAEGVLNLGVSCNQSDWQLSSLAQAFSSFFPQALNLTVEHLYIFESASTTPVLRWQDDIESGQWLELFHPFNAVKSLYISREFTPRIAPALQELVGKGVTEVLPSLQTLFLEETLPPGPVQEAIGQFVAARQLAGHPTAVSHWERKKSD
jgi:hypothetical protein